MLNKNIPAGDKLMKHALEADDDVARFVSKVTNSRSGLVTPKDFELISEVMTEKLAGIAPSTKTFITFMKETAKSYVPLAGNEEINWVNYRGKKLTQFYYPDVEEAISFKDPITGRTVTNIYKGKVEDAPGLLRSAKSAGDAATGLGVNGNHMNDASLVQGYWLKARKDKLRVASIHDGFFSHVSDADWTKDTLNGLMADAVDSQTIKKTLRAQRDAAIEYVSRANRRERAKMLDKVISRANDNKLTKDDIKNIFDIYPGLKATVKNTTNLDDRQLSRAIGNIHKRNQLGLLRSNINEGRLSISVFNDTMKDIPGLEKILVREFGVGKNQLLNEYAKPGARRRLLNQQEKFEAGTLNQFGFFKGTFQEPSLTDIEKGKYSLVKKKARAAGKPIPEVSKALGKKPSPQEVMRTRYGIKNERDFRDKVDAGEFDFDNFFKTELARQEGGLDLDKILNAITEVSKSKEPDLDISAITKGFKRYRNTLVIQDIKRRKAIREWYKERIKRAQELQLIDKNETNKKQLRALDALKRRVDTKRSFTQTDRSLFFQAWESDLEKYWGFKNFTEFDRAYRSGNFKMTDFLEQQENRYRALTKNDLLRGLKEGEDRYGIGP